LEGTNGFDAAWRYLSTGTDVLGKIHSTQHGAIEEAARVCADSICSDGLVFCWGGGHSRMSVEEMFPRIGSFPGFYPMVELAMTFYTNFVGADGMPQSFFLERQEGYVDAILQNYEFGPNDAMICFSSTGINEVVVEMALQAKSRGLPVVAVTSVAHADATAPRHSSGKKLKDVADVTIDNCTPPGDAAVDIKGLKYKVGPTSTIGAVAVANALKCRTAELMVEMGVEPVVLTSPHFVEREEEAKEQLGRVYAEFKRRKRMVFGRE